MISLEKRWVIKQN